MDDSDNASSPSKKRSAEVEISRDNPYEEDDEYSDEETRTFEKASDEVLASRRIVKVRRNKNAHDATNNPFADINLVRSDQQCTDAATSISETDKCKDDPESRNELEKVEFEVKSTETCEEDGKKVDDCKVETDVSKPNDEGVDAIPENCRNDTAAGDCAKDEKASNESKNEGEIPPESEGRKESFSLNAFQQLSSNQNAFTGVSGTGFSLSTFSSSSIFGNSNKSSSLFNTGPSSVGGNEKGTGEGTVFTSMQDAPVQTGEEDETNAFTTDGVLFEFLDGAWKERGKGELKLNVSKNTKGKARLLMRAKGNFRLILNANLYAEMKMTSMEKRGITFACVNSVGDARDGLSTYALKFREGGVAEEFRAAVTEQLSKLEAATETA